MADNYLEQKMEDLRAGRLWSQTVGLKKRKFGSAEHSVNNSASNNSIKNDDWRIESLSFNLRGVEAKVAIPLKESPSEEEMRNLMKNMAVIPVQTHSVNVALVENSDDIFEADALVTFKNNLPIGVKTADCVPVVIYCPDVKGVAAIHAGWKGSINGVVDKTVDLLIQKGASPECMVVFFGPSISKKVYEVDRELAERFIEAGFREYVFECNEGIHKPRIDLQGINKERLLRRGVLRENILLNNGCTFSSKLPDGSDRYPSYRRSGGRPERLLTIISLK